MDLFEKLGFLNKNKVIGINIGSYAVKVAEIDIKGGILTLRRAGYKALPSTAIVEGSIMNSAAITDTITELIEEIGVSTKQVVTSLGGSSVIVKQISVPTMTPEELDEQITWEAEQHITFSVDEVNLAYHILGENPTEPGKMDIILIAAKRDLINDYSSVLLESGLTPVVFDIDSFAILNSFEINYPEYKEDVVALVDIGAAFTNVNVSKGGIPLVVREFTIGSNAYTEEIQKNLGVSSEEAEALKKGKSESDSGEEVIPQEVVEIMDSVSESLGGEIVRTLDFYGVSHPDEKVTRIALSGGGALVPSLDRIINEKTDLPVTIVNAFNNVKIPGDVVVNDPSVIKELSPIMSVVVGLAIRRRND